MSAPTLEPDTGPRARLLGMTLIGLAVAMTTASVLGPLVLGVMTYRTSATTLNQLLGSDAATLIVIAPLTLVAARLAWKGRPEAAPLASGVAVYALYTSSQVVIGQEYLRLPGNVERFFPLLLAVFVLAEATLVLAWAPLARAVPNLPRRLERVLGSVLLLVAAFLLLGLHLPSMVAAWTDPYSLIEYASAPTPFWMVKLMDLGIVVPVAVATGLGLLRGRGWARRAAYPLLTGYTCLAVSVTAMALVMLARHDPDASVALLTGFGAFTVALVALTITACRAVSLRPARTVPGPPAVAATVSRAQTGHSPGEEVGRGPTRATAARSERPRRRADVAGPP